MMECFLCEVGKCYLFNMGGNRVYCSLFPDLDPDSKKPLHILVSPEKHYESILEMPLEEYTSLMLAIRNVEEFYLSRGYGPAVTELRLHPGPHTPHVHIHLVFSSDSLRPLARRKRTTVSDEFLEELKKETAKM